jgi:hypothetical protein
MIFPPQAHHLPILRVGAIFCKLLAVTYPLFSVRHRTAVHKREVNRRPLKCKKCPIDVTLLKCNDNLCSFCVPEKFKVPLSGQLAFEAAVARCFRSYVLVIPDNA